MGFTRRFLTLLLGATALLAGTQLFPALLPAAVALAATALALAAVDAVLLRSDGGIDARRSAPDKLSVGVLNPVRLTVTLRARGPRLVRVTDAVPAHCPAEDLPATALLQPGQPHIFAYRLLPTRRGPASFGDIDARVRGPLGLVVRDFRVPAAAGAAVFPDIQTIRRAMLAWRSGRRFARRRFRIRERGDRFESLREYAQGDPMRDVYWKGTARFDRLLVKTRAAERNQSLLLALDTGRLMGCRIGGLTRLDHAANAALLAAFAGLENGDRVGLLAFDSRVRSSLAPAAGPGQLRRVLRFLQPLEPSRNEPDYARAIAHVASHSRRRTMVVIFTDVFGTEAVRALEAGARRSLHGHLVLVATVTDPDVERVAAQRSRCVLDTYRGAVAFTMLERRRRLLRSLIARGIRVVDVPAGALSTEVLNSYLRAKRRSLI